MANLFQVKEEGRMFAEDRDPSLGGKPEQIKVEHQRKFLVNDSSCIVGAMGMRIVQGYLFIRSGLEAKVRLKDNEAFLTIKGDAIGEGRLRFTYPIPVEHANKMLKQFCNETLVDKTRYQLDFHGATWEIDVFHGQNDGLILAEIDLENPEQQFSRPPWLGEEVTSDPRYKNASLSTR